MVEMGARKIKERLLELTGISCSKELNLGEIEVKLDGAKLSDFTGTLAQYIEDKKDLEKQLADKEKHLKNYRIACLRLARQKLAEQKQQKTDHKNYQQLIKDWQIKYNQEKNDRMQLESEKSNLQN
jgi:hypothetical protein